MSATAMAERVYCTYFDHNYLSRGLAMYHSLRRHAPGAKLWVLCLSEQCQAVLTAMKLPDLVVMPLAEFEAADPEVAATRSGRSTIEYFFTITPAWMLFVLKRETAAEWVTYLDGDLYFFASPEPIYAELSGAVSAIIPHRYAPNTSERQRFGTYNVGWVGARNTAQGLAVIQWWRERCIEWCHDYVDGERFADQGYLDSFPKLFASVKAIENVGANLAPWNIGNYRIGFDDGGVRIDDTARLLFFHFQGLRKGLGWFFFSHHRLFRAPFSAVTRNRIYKPYVAELVAIDRAVALLLPLSAAKPYRRSAITDIGQFAEGLLRSTRTRVFQLLDIFSGRALLVFRGTVY